MFAILLCSLLSADVSFLEGGYRADDPKATDAKSFSELASQAMSAKSERARATAAERMFQAFARYSGPLNVQYPTCHVGRTFEQLRQRDYAQGPRERFSPDEIKQFKAACYSMLRSPDCGRVAMEHLVAVVNQADLQPMLKLLRSQTHPGLACIALGRIGDDAAVPALAHELSGECKEHAGAALEYMATPKAKAALDKAGYKPPPD